MPEKYYINTSNKLKLREYKTYLGNVTTYQKDIPEPDADPLTIIRYKASQFEQVLVDDCSLEVEGADIGVRVKWLLNELHLHEGKKARFVCLLAQRVANIVYVYRGIVNGTLVASRGKKYGFLSYFQPDGSNKTLAQELPDKYNARYYAVKDFLTNAPFAVCKPLRNWSGSFQKN